MCATAGYYLPAAACLLLPACYCYCAALVRESLPAVPCCSRA